ncbi:unnamed protein product [Auanema sp. JU1783]|nr:unnamed protein product [Auanema sp. JU1783]
MIAPPTRRPLRKVDDFFELDCFQLIVLLFNEFLIYTMLSNMVFNIFGISKAELRGCDDEIFNGTIAERCNYFLNTNCTKPIVHYEFQSTVAEFELYCPARQETYLGSIMASMGVVNRAKFSTTIQMIGIIIGSAAAGQLSDLYGRKKITLSFLILIFVTSFVSTFSIDMDFYIIMRFLIGLAGGGLNTVSGIYIVEMLPANHRIWLSTVITWAPNYLLFALIAKLTGTWRGLSFVNSMITLAAVFICAFLLPESPKFLVQKRREQDFLKALLYVNRFKRTRNQYAEEEIEAFVFANKLRTHEEKQKKYSFRHLYSNNQLAIRTMVCSISMFSLSFVTYGLIFNLDVIKGSIYLNTAFSGMLRWIVGATIALSDHFGHKYVGRRRLHYTTMSVIATCMALTFAIYATGREKELATLIQCLTLFAFGTTGSLFLQILIVASELFPTGVRNLAVANINVCGRIGNVFGPMVFSLPPVISGLPYMIMSALCFLDVGLFAFFIPETKGVPLPNDMPAGRKKKEDVAMVELLKK